MPLGTPIGLNEQIKQNALNDTEWRHHDDVEWLYAIGDLLNKHFFEGKIPQVVIGLDDTGRLKKSGEFHFEGDGVSLKNHIDLKKGLTKLEQVLALVHNYVHAETSVYGTPKTWYHSAAFRKRMTDFGLKVNKSGDLTAVNVETFTPVLEKLHAVGLTAELETMVVGPDPEPAMPPLDEMPVPIKHDQTGATDALHPPTHAGVPILTAPASQNFMGGPGAAPSSFVAWNSAKTAVEAGPGPVAGTPWATSGPPTAKKKSAMIKWSCGCTNIRCAVKLEAQCLKCGNQFIIVDKNVVGTEA